MRKIILHIVILTAFCCVSSPAEELQILIANDDGYDAPGIVALAKEMKKLGHVTVVAPKINRSGSSHSIIYKVPIFFSKVDSIEGLDVWWVDTTPASSIRWALGTLFKDKKPDLIVSGINKGVNIGNGVYYSGTVGAAREGALAGIPAIAYSLDTNGDIRDYEGAAVRAREIAETYLKMKDRPQLLNVNLPKGKITADTQVKVTTVGVARYTVAYKEYDNPRNNRERYYWVILTGSETPKPGTDMHELWAGYITVTPVIVEATDGAYLEPLRDVFNR